MTEPEGSLPAKRIIKSVFTLFDKNIHFIKAKASLIIISRENFLGFDIAYKINLLHLPY